MRSLITLFIFVFAATLSFGQLDIATQVIRNTGVPTDTIPPVGFPYATAFNFNYSTLPGVNGGTVGAMFINGKYILHRWNSTMVYRFNANGPGGGPGTLADSITYAGAIRDLARNAAGTRLFGGNSTTGILEFDLNTMATVKTFTLTGGATRAIAWDDTRKGFWNTAFGGNIFLHDTTGALKQTITSTLTGKYGLAFDSLMGQQAFLWAWNQGTGSTTNTLHKYSIATGLEVANYTFTLTGASIGIAGGAEICNVNGKMMLLLNYQNFALVGYFMGDFIPVEFVSFAGSVNGSSVTLNWATATEKNNLGFDIMRKSGDGEYIQVGFMPGKGSTLETNHYSFLDQSVPAGTYTYRLRQRDYDGTIAHSGEVTVNVTNPVEFELSQNYPNPFNPSTTINFTLPEAGFVNLSVFDVLGQKVAELVNSNLTAGAYSQVFDASNLNSGLYFYTITTGSSSVTKKMQLIK